MNKTIKKSNRNRSMITKSSNQAKNSKSRKKSYGRKSKSGEVIQYVFPVGLRGWVVKNSRLAGFTLLTDSKQEAIFYARSIAQRRGELLVVHGRDMKVEERKKYRKPARKNLVLTD